MAECFVGGNKQEGKYAWKKEQVTAALGSSISRTIRTDGYGQSSLTIGDSLLIAGNGTATLANPRQVSLLGSPFLSGYYLDNGLHYVNTQANSYTDSESGVPWCAFSANQVTVSVSVDAYVVDDDYNKYTQSSAPPGGYIYEKIS